MRRAEPAAGTGAGPAAGTVAAGSETDYREPEPVPESAQERATTRRDREKLQKLVCIVESR